MEKVKDCLLDKMLKQIPLKTRVKVTIESYLLNRFGGSLFISHNESGEECQEQIKLNEQIIDPFSDLIKQIFDDIDEWNEDGRPE